METRNKFNHLLTIVLPLLLCASLAQAVDDITPGSPQAGISATARESSYRCDIPQKCREIDEAWRWFAENAGSTYFNQVWDVRTGDWADFSTVYPEESEEPESQQLPRTATEFSTTLSPEIIDGILSAGKWSVTADDTIFNEKLPWSLVVNMAEENPGLLSLFFAVAEWGIEDPPADLVDPKGTNWDSTKSIADGKHLMSYKYGKLGIAHYVGSHLEVIYGFFGVPNDRTTGSEEWRIWAKTNLQKKELQTYLIERWLENFWSRAITNTNGDIKRALVNARIANTNPADAQEWGGLSIDEQISQYTIKHAELDRVPHMQRAVAVYEYIQNHH